MDMGVNGYGAGIARMRIEAGDEAVKDGGVIEIQNIAGAYLMVRRGRKVFGAGESQIIRIMEQTIKRRGLDLKALISRSVEANSGSLT